MIRRALGLAVFGGATVIAACTSDATPEKYPTVASFCDGKAAAECDAVGAVCGVESSLCKATRAAACRTAAAADAGRAYTPGLAQGCIDKTTALYQGSRVIDPQKEAAYTDACERVFAGTKKDGERCTQLYECTGICDVAKGFCGTKVEKASGQQCNNAGEICAKGFYCQLRDSLRFCADKKKVDEACADDAPCLEDLRCLTGKCAPKIAIGSSCDQSADCVSGVCDSTKKCVAKQYETETSSCKDFGGSG